LRKWIYAIHSVFDGQKGISSIQLKRETGVTYKTGCKMLKQIGHAMQNKMNFENESIYDNNKSRVILWTK
jgi:hypothetical protein